jgi:hypothetical protein
MSNFLNIPALPATVSNSAMGNMTKPFSLIGTQFNIMKNSNSFGNYMNQMSPATKRGLFIMTCAVVFICIIIYQIYKYYQLRWKIRDSLYYFETFNMKNNSLKLYYGTPLRMNVEAIPGGQPGSFWYRTDPKIRILSGNNFNINDGVTIRMWLKISSDNFQQNTNDELERVIFTKGLADSEGSTNDIINNPNLLLTNRNWASVCQLGLFLDRRVNRLHLQVGKNSPGGTFKCPIDDIPIKKWFQLSIRISIGVIDVYIDGELYNTWSITEGFTIPNGSAIALFHQIPTVGFWGWTCFFQSIPKVLTPNEVYERFMWEVPDMIEWERRDTGPEARPTVNATCTGADSECGK